MELHYWTLGVGMGVIGVLVAINVWVYVRATRTLDQALAASARAMRCCVDVEDATNAIAELVDNVGKLGERVDMALVDAQAEAAHAQKAAVMAGEVMTRVEKLVGSRPPRRRPSDPAPDLVERIRAFDRIPAVYELGLLDPADTRPDVDQMADRLRQAIAAGTFGQGKPLPRIATMAHYWAASTYKVREAVRRVETEGAIRKGPDGVWYVRGPTTAITGPAPGQPPAHDTNQPPRRTR